jgi:hypothetical protein
MLVKGTWYEDVEIETVENITGSSLEFSSLSAVNSEPRKFSCDLHLVNVVFYLLLAGSDLLVRL